MIALAVALVALAAAHAVEVAVRGSRDRARAALAKFARLNPAFVRKN